MAISTYFIAIAGRSLTSQHYEQVLNQIALFFIFALCAYVTSSIATLILNTLQNQLWQNYIINTFDQINFNQSLATRKNKQDLVGWLVGEAATTLGDVSNFIIQALSLYANIILTFFVFGITLGIGLTSIMSISLLLSVIIVTALKKRIQNYGNKIQSKKLIAILSVSSLWDFHFHGSRALYNEFISEHFSKMAAYFKQTEKYAFTEQFIATFPIIFSVPILIGAMFYFYKENVSGLGVLVAVLPRSLQLFGNVHAINIFNSKIILMRTKYKNLMNFVKKLEQRILQDQLREEKITIFDCENKKFINYKSLVNGIKLAQIVRGRFTICGDNGTGKSTLLMMIKAFMPNAIMISPEVNLLSVDHKGSAGEMQVQQLNYVFSKEAPILLLDEWDVNLDTNNVEKFDRAIAQISNSKVVLEVRH